MNRLELAHDYAKIIFKSGHNKHTVDYKEVAERAAAMADALLSELGANEMENRDQNKEKATKIYNFVVNQPCSEFSIEDIERILNQ